MTDSTAKRDIIIPSNCDTAPVRDEESLSASEYSQMLRVRGEDLRILCEQYPDTGILILERLATVIAERLRNTHDQVMDLLKQGMGNSMDSY